MTNVMGADPRRTLHAVTATSYYRRVAPGSYEPTIFVQGAWNDHEQHMSVVGGLITAELLAHDPRPEMQLGRLSFEILGLIPAERTDIEVTTIRPGRTIELLEATVTIGGRVIIRARAWRLSIQDTAAVAANELPAMPAPADCAAYNPSAEWPGEFLASLDALAAPGGRSGRRSVWARSTKSLIEGEQVPVLADFVTLVDLANGIATRVRPTEMMFPNVELSIHFFRMPVAGWVGLDTSVSFGATGLGLTSTVLNDERGPLGVAAQSLTVRDFPAR